MGEDHSGEPWAFDLVRRAVPHHGRRGRGLAGEARLVDAMVPRRARILDAGCGTGRVGAHLAAAGHEVVGVDIDPVLISAAREDHPGPRWIVGDLAELDLPAQGITEPFHAVVCAGNVMPFVEPRKPPGGAAPVASAPAGRTAGRRSASARDAGRLRRVPRGRSKRPGWCLNCCSATWDLRPFTAESDFLVALLRPA